MGAPDDDPAEVIAAFLERNGLEVERSPGGDTFVVRSGEPGAFAHEPVVRLPGELLRSYLEQMAGQLRKYADPHAEALWLTKFNILEDLTTDHDGNGMNYAQVVGVRRGRNGRPELFVEQDPPDPEPLDPGSGPYEWRADRP
jgi:hypothetical protein